ncbi:MAG: ABC transporter ATP-binding protein [Oscillospiraceae bacterium]|jgi:ABC-2 type transport system ATP-binding protein|nr:ABC transporter ATP-binding protein [Oscillospiraceae bacterium]MDD3260958.1 ABC transporter ATP-binding protein [Oscillospiraceae bacterium]
MEPILQCSGLCKNYGGKQALHDVNLKIERGRIVGLLGPNGSGKSTLIKLCSGLLTPTAGSLTIDGTAPGVETKRAVSYLPERSYLGDWMRVNDLLSMFSDFYADFDLSKALDMLQRLSISLSSPLRTMSKGTREKVQLILVMSRNAELYLLDEPIGGVDPAARDYILNTIINNYSENATVILSTHLIADVEKILDEVIFLREGSVLLHTPADELREHEGKSVDACFREVFKC